MLIASAGDRQAAYDKIQQVQQMDTNFAHFHHTAYNLASAYALLNQPAEAVEWLRRAATDGYPNYFWFERDPNLNSITNYGAFKQFMSEQRSQWERFKSSL